jgi:cytochrome c553
MAAYLTPFRLLLAGAALLAGTACSPQTDPETGRNMAPSAGLPSANATAGQAIAERKGKATGQSCIDCHGADGNAPIDPTYPKLGGQYADYLAHALVGYRDGSRAHVLMNPQAADLSDQEIADVAAWFAQRPSQLRDLTTLP